MAVPGLQGVVDVGGLASVRASSLHGWGVVLRLLKGFWVGVCGALVSACVYVLYTYIYTHIYIYDQCYACDKAVKKPLAQVVCEIASTMICKAGCVARVVEK